MRSLGIGKYHKPIENNIIINYFSDGEGLYVR